MIHLCCAPFPAEQRGDYIEIDCEFNDFDMAHPEQFSGEVFCPAQVGGSVSPL